VRELLKSRNLAILVLVSSLFLILARPAIMTIMDRKDLGFNLNLDYGFSMDWYKDRWDKRPLRMALPEDSIGLDYLNIDSCLRSNGLRPEIYEWNCVGDPFARPYTYPPLLTIAFLWILLFPTKVALGLWCVAVLVLIFANAYFWAVFGKKCLAGQGFSFSFNRGLVFAALFTMSYPSVFFR